MYDSHTIYSTTAKKIRSLKTDDDNTFDYVHQRLMILGVPRTKVPDILRELVRVTKPGGWIELVEADGVFYNAGPYSKTFGGAFFDALHRRGLDCYAATNLPWFTRHIAANVENQEIQTLQIPINWGSKMGVLSGQEVRSGFLTLEDWLHRAIGITREEYRQLMDDCFNEWKENKTFMLTR
ncbi:hypothetical protein HK100_007130, partial [Physocladia obscura]